MSKYDLYARVLYKGETTYGTSSTPDTEIGSVQNIARNDTNGFIYTRGTNRTVQEAVYGGYGLTLSGTYQLHDFAFLRHFIGPLTGDGLAQGTAYTLTQGDYSSNSTTVGIQSFTMDISDPITDEKTLFTGCAGNDFTINGSEGGILTCAFNIIGQKPTRSNTATSYTEPTTLPWHFSQMTFKYGDTPSAVSQLISFSITYTNNLEPRYAAGAGRFIRQPIAQNIDITFNITIRATSAEISTLINDFYGATDTPTTLSSSSTLTENKQFKLELTEGSGAGLRNADITLDDAAIETMNKPVDVSGGDNLVDFTFSGRCFTSKDSKFAQWWSGTRS